MSTRAASRPHDVVLYGASGFVGRQTVQWFARHAAGLRWALGGRARDKLESARAAAGAGAEAADIVLADAHDAGALDRLAAGARVVLSTAGPFARHGSELVAACVRHGTHYVDITGETPWVRDLIDRHHDQAARQGTRIVPCCGFDSVPSDLGSWFVAQALWQDHGQRCTRVKAAFSLRGGFNGGTLASALNLLEAGERTRLQDPFLLNPAGTVPAHPQAHDDPLAPLHDADFGAWLAPFFMGPVNTRVVRRSAALTGGAPYAADFGYQEYLRIGRGAGAALASAGFSAALLAGQGALAFTPLRRVASRLLPAPGEGPSEQAMDGGGFRCELIGRGEGGAVQRARITHHGDPGNRATTAFVCAAACALAQDLDRLPGGPRHGGVLTPATAFGDVLLRRLREAGTTIEPVGR